MRRAAAVVSTVAAGALFASAVGAAPASAASVCRHRGEQVLIRGAAAEVLTARGDRHRDVLARRTFGCRFSDKRRFALGTNDGSAEETVDAHTLTVGGTYIGFVVTHDSGARGADVLPPDDGTRIVVQRLAGRGERRPVYGIVDSGGGPDRLATDLVVRKSGAIAWIGNGTQGGTQPYLAGSGVYACRTWGCAGTDERLDDDNGLDHHSLRATATGVSWRKTGVAKSSDLP